MQSAPVFALAESYAQLSPENLDRLIAHYAPNARFKDPFNDVVGHASIGRIFTHMFKTLHAPRFIICDRLGDAVQGFITWEMHFALPKAPQKIYVIKGASHVRFNEQGQVVLHRDYWDVAEELYEKWPLLGTLMRFLKKRMAA